MTEDRQQAKSLRPEPWMDRWDEVVAESFPASDPPAPPGSIGGPDREATSHSGSSD